MTMVYILAGIGIAAIVISLYGALVSGGRDDRRAGRK